jgi:itaconate CoA-transferase
MNDMHDLWRHPQLRARGRWATVDSPVGRLPALLPPALPSTATARMAPIPAVGEHTQAILARIGYSPDDIARLRAARAV